MGKTGQAGFSNSSYNLISNFTFQTPLRQLYFQTEQCYFYKKHISFNGIFNMETSLALPFTIRKTKNHTYLIFNNAIT